jgi:acetate kinase
MGLTPLEGLVMGTRSGDVDPNLHDFLARRLNVDLRRHEFQSRERLLGLSGLSNDMRISCRRSVRESRADVAIEVFCYRLAGNPGLERRPRPR